MRARVCPLLAAAARNNRTAERAWTRLESARPVETRTLQTLLPHQRGWEQEKPRPSRVKCPVTSAGERASALSRLTWVRPLQVSFCSFAESLAVFGSVSARVKEAAPGGSTWRPPALSLPRFLLGAAATTWRKVRRKTRRGQILIPLAFSLPTTMTNR